jgi:hypothetical protein
MRHLFALDNESREVGFVRDGHAQGAVGLNDVDAMDRNLVEGLLLSGFGESGEDDYGEGDGQNAGVDG